MELSFLWASGEVTGSCFLLRTESVRFLVDCGLFQGGREAAGKNKRALVSAVATFLVHGEQPVSEAFGEAIRERLGWEVAIPARGSSVIVRRVRPKGPSDVDSPWSCRSLAVTTRTP